MQYTAIGTTWRKLFLISGHARRDRSFQFTSLAHLLDAEYLRDCYESLNRNKAVGVDGVSWKEYGEELTENLERLVQKLKRKSYKPKPVGISQSLSAPEAQNSAQLLRITCTVN